MRVSRDDWEQTVASIWNRLSAPALHRVGAVVELAGQRTQTVHVGGRDNCLSEKVKAGTTDLVADEAAMFTPACMSA